MGSRRLPSRGWGSGGRSGAGGDGEDDGPVWTPSPASRSYLLSVRPETSLSSNRLPHPSSGRSTFCSIIAQLTEETQPLFETTLKSKAVSEDSDVRFTCIVTGYPEPEVTWYKDDTELDRYCGLPKYEITHQGNCHTLQLYRCREEDAAIYQASARNTKGIVSCSGVLEVGTMTEYKIHQRWFAKLKRKAAAKMREIEQSWKHGKEAGGDADVLRKLSPDRFQRKRRLSGGEAPGPSAPTGEANEEPRPWQEGDAESAQHPGLGLITSLPPEELPTNGEATPENGEDAEHGLLTYICEAMELGPHRAPRKESRAKKKKKEEESKQGQRRSESEQAARGQCSSENCVASPDLPESPAMQGPRDTEQVCSQPRGRAPQGPGSSRTDNTRKAASSVGSKDKAQNTPAPAPCPGPAQDVYFSLKDMYLESTREAKPQGEEGSQAPSVRAPRETLSRKAGDERVPAAPGQPVPSLAPQPTKPLNRKRFAPPKPKAEPSIDSKPSSPLSQAPEHAAQSSRKAPPPSSSQVPTPPARRRHGTRDSPSQGRAVHRTSGEVQESQVTTTLTPLASSGSGAAPVGDNSTSRSQCVIEPMDTDIRVDVVSSVDQRTRGKQERQLDGKMQADGRAPADTTPRTQKIQASEKTEVDVITQGSERLPADESAQRDVLMQTERTQVDEKAPKGTRMQEAKAAQSEGSTPTATNGQQEPRAWSNPSPESRVPQLPSSEAPRLPQGLNGFAQTPAEVPVAEKVGFVLISEEVTGAMPPRAHEGNVLGCLPGPLPVPAQPLPQESSEQEGGEQSQGQEWPGPVKTPQEDRLSPCPEVQPGDKLGTDPGGYPTTDPSQEVPRAASLPGPALADRPQEGLPHSLASTHSCPATILPAVDQALPSSAPTLHLGPGPPPQNPPPETLASSSEGACAQAAPREGGTSGPRSCDPGLIDSLKNYLLLLLKLSSTETSGVGAEAREGSAVGGLAPPSTLAPSVEVAGLSPRTSRRILERVENNHLLQSAQSLLLSPCTSRRLTGLLDREVQAGQRALAAAQGSRTPGPNPFTVPSIVVGEEGTGQASAGAHEGEEEGSLEGPGGLLGQAGKPAAPEQGLLPAGGRAQEAFPADKVPGEAVAELPAATPEELALGARRKRFLPKVRASGDGEAMRNEERESPSVSPRGSRKSLAPGSPGTPGRERRSPNQSRRASMLEVPRAEEELTLANPKAGELDTEPSPEEGKQEVLTKPRKAGDQLKAPQVIRKIRVEQFPDASGSLKLWCQFFNILSDSVLTWAKDQHPVGEVGRSAGDEGPAALAIVQASPVDCGVYRCTIHNEHGMASTDFCLSPEVLSGFISREEGEVGEEIEMTPMVFAKGLADSGCWGDKLFGRLVSEELRGHGRGCGLRKASQAKVIYGLDPLFESGRTCIIKVRSLLVFGPSSETSLLGRNYDVTIQGCKIQNMSREYCKIFAAEARAVPGFGEVPEIIPLYLIYRPANTIPYATLEEDLGRPLESYCSRDWGCAGPPTSTSLPEAVHKCQTFQHWLYQWTNGSFLVTDLAATFHVGEPLSLRLVLSSSSNIEQTLGRETTDEDKLSADGYGVDWKMTDVQIATKLRGYQGLKESCYPALLDQFASSHQCNSYCERLGLKALKGPEAHPQAKAKGSKSPSAGRKGQLSPQPQKKGPLSPQGARRSASSTKATLQVSEAAAVQFLGEPPTQEGGCKAQGMR